MRPMNARAPVERSYLARGSDPREVYDVVVDFEAYPSLFPELKAVRVLDRGPSIVRVEFRAEVVLAVRYVLDLRCDPDALTVDWTYVEGEIVVDSTGGWRFLDDPAGTKVEYRVSMLVKAPLPGFIVRKATDALVAASIPGMFLSIDREARRRRETRGT
jgi:ribosome-associated toxin RatA of RatAB toxin-antitoxin module